MGFDRYFGFNLQQRKTLIALLAEVAAGDSTAIADLEESVDNLNAWATALATKLNADAGVTDTNYDTNPQA